MMSTVLQRLMKDLSNRFAPFPTSMVKLELNSLEEMQPVFCRANPSVP